MKCWNIRDQTTEKLKEILNQTYKEIKKADEFIKKAQTIEDAKFYVDLKFRKKSFADDINMELIRREISNETTEDEET